MILLVDDEHREIALGCDLVIAAECDQPHRAQRGTTSGLPGGSHLRAPSGNAAPVGLPPLPRRLIRFGPSMSKVRTIDVETNLNIGYPLHCPGVRESLEPGGLTMAL